MHMYTVHAVDRTLLNSFFRTRTLCTCPSSSLMTSSDIDILDISLFGTKI